MLNEAWVNTQLVYAPQCENITDQNLAPHAKMVLMLFIFND